MKLDVEGNKLTVLSEDMLASWSMLTELNAAKNLLTSIPDNIGVLSRLIRLDFHQNRISAIPASIKGCCSLTEFYMGTNLLSSLPEEMGELSHLGTLDLHSNQLKEFPVKACKLRVSVLDLSNNSLSGLPPELASGSSSTPMKEDLVAAASRLSLSSKELSLCGLGLSSVPVSVWEGDDIVKVDLSRNTIEELPSELSSCSSLQELVLSGNKIKDWPGAVLASLANLTCLKIDNNPLQQGEAREGEGRAAAAAMAGKGSGGRGQRRQRLQPLQEQREAQRGGCDGGAGGRHCRGVGPEGVARERTKKGECDAKEKAKQGRGEGALHRGLKRGGGDVADGGEIPTNGLEALSKLQILDLSGLSHPELPAFSCLHHLRELYLRRMLLREVPPDLLGLQQLKILDLSQNFLVSVPKEFKDFTSLTELILSDNNITTLPAELGLLECNLQVLKLDGNPLRSIRRPILDRGTKAILKYLKDKLPEP
ncbi:hypothetical protein Taro_021200 [Colocasia esculenta]|uniref:Leucine-rich repeat-containing protein 40 n=1 Tax=Colocasia esculenta TaxID=4460 RepID=A0A843VAS3_COLES|nr:hypothetical protein [Colocasia esculenta]